VAGVAQKDKNLGVADRSDVSLVKGETSVALVLILMVCGLVAASCSSPTVTRGSGKATGVTALGPDLVLHSKFEAQTGLFEMHAGSPLSQ
jgi:hypothetical protein